MGSFRIEAPGGYRTRAGNGVEVLMYHLPRDCWIGFTASGKPVAWNSDGLLVDRMAHESALSGDIIAPWTEPKTGTVWVNVYAPDRAYGYSTRAEADEAAGEDRTACVSVKWTEGEGL